MVSGGFALSGDDVPWPYDSSARRFTLVSSHSMMGRVYMFHGRSLSLPGPHGTRSVGVGDCW